MNDPELPPTHWHAIVARYQKPDRWRSLWQAANSIFPFLVLWYLMYRSLAISYWLTLLLAIPTAGFMVRTFIIFHDCGHGSFFKSRSGNDIMGFITGILTLTPYYEWRHTHAVHHATAGDLDRRGTGDVLTLTIAEYKALPWWKKFGYRTMRNPLIMFTIGSFLVFTVAHRFWHPGAGKREVWSVIWTDLALAAIFIAMSLTIGWKAFMLVEAPVIFIATGVGVWLFYVQHNFDRTYWERHSQWDFFKAGNQRQLVLQAARHPAVVYR